MKLLTNEWIQEQYDLKVDNQIEYRSYQAFQSNGCIYTFIPVNYMNDDQLQELYQLATFMRANGDSSVSEFLFTKSGSLMAKVNNDNLVLLKHAANLYRRRAQPGKELAKFHRLGRSFPITLTKINRIGQWKVLWEKRLDQMEMFWREKIKSNPSNEFEKEFFGSFPYYLGLSENAIQYLVDTELDDKPQIMDSGTICHRRFTRQTWKDGSSKLPTNWIFDHGSRDLAEWIRDDYLRENKFDQARIQQFLANYEQITPLSTFSSRLLFSRLIFPVHYFECIENYYLTDSEQQKRDNFMTLKKMNDHSSQYEQFLGDINKLLIKRFYPYQSIPELDWVKA